MVAFVFEQVLLIAFVIYVYVHDHLLDLELEKQDLLITLADFHPQGVYLGLEAATDLIVLEVPDPVKDVLFGLLFEDVLLQDFVARLQLL